MKLIDIVKADQDRYTMITVNVNSNHGWVEIKDEENEKDAIFLQGDDAICFINKAEDLWCELEYVTISECYHHLAIPYAENLWS